MAARAPRLPPPALKRPLASPHPPTPIYPQVNDNRPATPGPIVQSLLTDRGPGRPLPSRVRESMELALGHSFAEIRIHTDAQATAAAEELHARAFTAGTDIFFAEGAFDPEAPAGRDLLAHELAHAATQPEGAPFDPALLEAAPGDPLAEQAVVAPEEPEPPPPDQAEPAPVPETSEAPAPAEGEAADEAAPPEVRGEGEGGREERGDGAAEGEGAAAGELATGESPPSGRSDVELLMPPPPDRPSAGQTERIERSTRAAGRAAGQAEDLPSAGESTAAARGAVDEPEAETRGRAEATLAGALEERPAPSPEILELCEVIRASIKAKRPVDEDELVETDPHGVAEEAGTALNQNVQGEADQVDASYDELDDPPPGEAEQIGEPFETPPAEAALPDLQAAEAAPDPIPEEDLSLDADVERADADMAAAGMDTPAAQVAQEGPVAEARAARGEVGELAQQSPAELAAAQDQAIAAAQGDMAALQQQALERLNAARAGTVAGVTGQQGAMVTSEVATRERISAEARQIFTTTQSAVDGLLRPLPQTAMELWDAGIAKASTRFEEALARVKAWIDERHSGVGGAILGAWDALTGLPDWVTEEYDRAEQQFGDDVCDLLVDISTQVNAVIQTCELLISGARSQIDALFADLPESLRAWAEEEKARLNGQLDQLGERVQSAQAEVTSGLRERAVSAVAEVQRRVAELREQARGILGKIADAIAAFIDDPVKFIIEGILKLLGISPAAFWAVVAKIEQVIDDIADDPLGFANNLVSAIGQGFQKFFDNFLDHLIGGFFDWLFSGLGAVGVTIPSDFSLPSIITFALELMGITWARIREILARHIGEENVALLEKAYELISTLIERGPEGIFEMIKEQLNPQTILDQIIRAAVDYLVEALIKAVTPRIIALFNPAGAIVQAIEVIFRVLKWIFENAARIFSLIETVVGGAADLVAGNIGGMATAVEGALARLIAPVIDFLASFLGLGDLPEKIAETIRGFQEMVLGIIDRVVAWLAERARGLLRALGFGEEPGSEEAEGERAEDSELGASVTFAGGGETHRQWIEIQGTDAVLMVASDGPGPVEAKLAEWRGRLPEQFAGNDAGRQEAEGLLDSAGALLGQAVSKADALVTAYRQASQSEDAQELPSDDPLESDQQRLGAALRRLFELFGGDPKAHLAKVRAAMPAHAAQFKDVIHASWGEQQIEKVRIGAEDDAPRMWRADVLRGTQHDALAFATDPSWHEQLLPFFITGERDRSADTQTFYDYVFVNRDVPHGGRPRFLEAAGDPAASKLKAQGKERLALHRSRGAVSDDYVQRVEPKLEAIGYDVDVRPYGRFELPAERTPDHARFRPLSIVTTVEGNEAVTRYHTEAGQTFEVRANKDTGLVRNVIGRNLRFMTGRGVTQDAPAFRPGQDFNRSHIIANEIGGSGYRESLNLLTTSAQYNQVDMRQAERRIGQAVEAFAAANDAQKVAVSIELEVSVTFGELLDQEVLARIRAQPWYPKDAPDIEAVILQKIDAGEIVDNLRRVTGLIYIWTATLPNGMSANGLEEVGEDLYLLTAVGVIG